MQLNEAIAKQIVERSMKIIKYSVNVMDEQGIIIGSGDAQRISARHEGALLAINENRIVEIDNATAKQLRGVKPGINLPIIFQDKTIGVVGISGNPDDVRFYGGLVKMTAELIVEQAELITQIQWNKRHREESILQLALPSELTETQLHSITQRLNLDPIQPRIAVLVKVTPFEGQPLSLTHLQRLVHLLEFPERDNLVAIVSVSKNEILVLKSIILDESGWSCQLEKKRAKKLIQRITLEEKFTIRIAFGNYFPDLKGLSQSFKSAKATLESSNSKDNILFYQDHILPVLLHGLKQDCWSYQQLLQPLEKLRQNDPKGVLLKTLKLFFSRNCDIAQTCKALYIHRNTLRYRLEKIEQETGLNINKIDDKTRLYLSIMTVT
ncbi:sugar diacid recognition domain-containing protein [Psychromonas hadalis]|uniref:sugar diacid recognition domain-containing protein n=1 Tax=Psychromonas hadalis TaxID=211669 RepID=UPI0003B438AA|nr:sugar diacid recognition domain-containing protein [Psychromonas hadalis]